MAPFDPAAPDVMEIQVYCELFLSLFGGPLWKYRIAHGRGQMGRRRCTYVHPDDDAEGMAAFTSDDATLWAAAASDGGSSDATTCCRSVLHPSTRSSTSGTYVSHHTCPIDTPAACTYAVADWSFRSLSPSSQGPRCVRRDLPIGRAASRRPVHGRSRQRGRRRRGVAAGVCLHRPALHAQPLHALPSHNATGKPCMA